MSENLKTIKELADELGVSKQTIRNKIDKDFREKFVQTIKIKGNNTLVINNAGYSLLKKTLQNDKFLILLSYFFKSISGDAISNPVSPDAFFSARESPAFPGFVDRLQRFARSVPGAIHLGGRAPGFLRAGSTAISGCFQRPWRRIAGRATVGLAGGAKL